MTDNLPEKIIRPTFGTVEGGRKSVFLSDGGGDLSDVLVGVSLGDFDSLKLSDPKYGDVEIGTLTDEECIQFARFHTVMTRHKELTRELGGAQLEKIGAGIRSGEIDIEHGPADGDNFIDHDLAKEYFCAQSYLDYTKSAFYHGLYVRLGNWDHSLGIRTKRRIVRAKRRY